MDSIQSIVYLQGKDSIKISRRDENIRCQPNL